MILFLISSREKAVVKSQASDRSYIIETPRGTLRRNRRHLVPCKHTTPFEKDTDDVEPDTPGSGSNPDPIPNVRRSNRTVRRPERLIEDI